MKIFVPINTLEDINIATNMGFKKAFFTAKAPFNSNLRLITSFLKSSQELNVDLYIRFESNIYENQLESVKYVIDSLNNTSIKGFIFNDLSSLSYIEDIDTNKDIVIDSGLDIHNLSSIDFFKNINKLININITEEIYIKNINKIKKFTKHKLLINSDNLPWIINDIKKQNSINGVIVKGEFSSSKEFMISLKVIKEIIEDPEHFKAEKLPFKIKGSCIYTSNHFSKELISSTGADFGFKKNIEPFDWNCKKTRLKISEKLSKKDIPNLCLKFSSLDQILQLEKFIKKIGFNPVSSIDYGEILNTSDLAKNSFNMILEQIKEFCNKYQIKLAVSTPKILIERDFDRVYEYVKDLMLSDPRPDSIIVNNLGFLNTIATDFEYDNISIELGSGLNIVNSESIIFLNKLKKISAIDFSNFKDLKLSITNLKNKVKKRKYLIAGSQRIPSSGLCPLNNDNAILSRLSCSAPCHKGIYAIIDPRNKRKMPFIVDGFCRMHLFEDQILDNFNNIKNLENMGINCFIIDFNCLSSNLVPILMTRFLNSIENKNT